MHTVTGPIQIPAKIHFRHDPATAPDRPSSTDSSLESVVAAVVSTLVDCVSQEMHPADPGNLEPGRGSAGSGSSEDGPRPIYRTPEFRWSHIHVKLLADLLLAIETDIAEWKTYDWLDFLGAFN